MELSTRARAKRTEGTGNALEGTFSRRMLESVRINGNQG